MPKGGRFFNMTGKGFAKAEEISKEDMEKLARADAEAAVKGQKEKRATKAYRDEFTEEGDEAEVPEELEEPEVPEKKEVQKKNPTETTERSSKEIAQDIYNQGFNAGFKYRTKELIELLVG